MQVQFHSLYQFKKHVFVTMQNIKTMHRIRGPPCLNQNFLCIEWIHIDVLTAE